MASVGGSPGSLEDAAQTASKRVKLTAVQRRERKRKLDREAQRAVREKTKNHIAHLEGLVKALQNPEGTDGRMQELVAQIETGHEEVKVLRDALGSIGKIVNGIVKNGNCEDQTNSILKMEDRGPPCSGDIPGKRVFPKSSESPPESSRTSVRSMSGDQQAGNILPGTNPFAAAAAQADPSNPALIDEPLYGVIDAEPYVQDPRATGNNVPQLARNELSSTGIAVSDYPHVNPALVPQGMSLKAMDGTIIRHYDDDMNDTDRFWSYSEPPLTKDCPTLIELKRVIEDTVNMVMMNPGFKSRYWYLGGMILQHLLTRPDAPLTPRHMDEDIAIRACLHGWQAVEQQYALDGCWQWLKVLDTHMYSHLGFPERMAILRIKRTKFLSQVRPGMSYELKLPAFMKPRPAQEHVQHDALVEYFVWPGMREHILFTPTKYATDAFMEPFRQNLHFLWPHEPQDIYNRDPISGLYNFSDLWTGHMSHIGCWRINSDFFEYFPHLRPDIPCSTENPANSRSLVGKTFKDARRIRAASGNRAEGARRGSVALFGEQEDEEVRKRNENNRLCTAHTLASVPVEALLAFTA